MIERYFKADHLKLIKGWLRDWKLEMDEETMSDVGFVIDNQIAGFLLITNAKTAIIENFVCDPNLEKDKKEELNVRLINILTQEAVARGCKLVTLLAGRKPMVDRMEKLGWKNDGTYELYYRGLKCLG